MMTDEPSPPKQSVTLRILFQAAWLALMMRESSRINRKRSAYSMEETDAHFDAVHRIALAELEQSEGCTRLCDQLLPPFDTIDLSQIEDWVKRLSSLLSTDCWQTREFEVSCKTHKSHLLYVAETGDVPEIVNVGFPMMEVPHSFENIGMLADGTTVMLPQLIENISDSSFDDNPYFECTDLFHCYLDDFGLVVPAMDEIENMDASRLMVDSIALLSMIDSWQNVDPAPAADVYFCTSSGSFAFGRPIYVQKQADRNVAPKSDCLDFPD